MRLEISDGEREVLRDLVSLDLASYDNWIEYTRKPEEGESETKEARDRRLRLNTLSKKLGAP